MQLDFIASQYSLWITNEILDECKNGQKYYFTVCDLDQNGQLELLITMTQDVTLFTQSYLYEVSQNGTVLIQRKPNENSYITSDVYDSESNICYYDDSKNEYYYIFHDAFMNEQGNPLSDSIKSLSLKDGNLAEKTLASCAWDMASLTDGSLSASYRDANRNSISELEYEQMPEVVYEAMELKTFSLNWQSLNSAEFTSQEAILPYLVQSWQGFSLS